MIYLKQHMFQIKQYLNMNAFNLIAGTYESKILTKHGSGECKCKVYRRTCD